MVYILPLTIFVLALIAGVVALRHDLARLVWIAAALLLGLIVWLVFEGRQAQGWDGIGYAIGAILMAAPAMLGLLLGGLIGVLRKRRNMRQ